MAQLFNTPENGLFKGIKSDLTLVKAQSQPQSLNKAKKGTPEYEEWLRKYREKRGAKAKDPEAGEKAKSILEKKGSAVKFDADDVLNDINNSNLSDDEKEQAESLYGEMMGVWGDSPSSSEVRSIKNQMLQIAKKADHEKYSYVKDKKESVSATRRREMKEIMNASGAYFKKRIDVAKKMFPDTHPSELSDEQMRKVAADPELKSLEDKWNKLSQDYDKKYNVK